MTKTISKSGTAGVFMGYIEVSLHKRGNKIVQNPSTHDEEPKTYSYHQVTGTAGGQKFDSGEVYNEQNLIKEVGRITGQVEAVLAKVCDEKKEPTIEMQLKQLGFL